MMPSSLQVLDHQLIFYIMYGFRQFHHRQKRREEVRVCQKRQLLIAKKIEQMLLNIEVGDRSSREDISNRSIRQ